MIDERRREGERWKIHREISIGDIIAILVAGAAVMASYYKLDSRISILEAFNPSIANRLDRIENKLDRVIENHDR